MSKFVRSVSVLALSIAMISASAVAAPTTKDKREQKTTDIKGDGIQVMGESDITATPVDDSKSPGLEISGGTSFNSYVFKQKQREQNGGKGRGTHFGADDSRINFQVLGKAGPELDGLEYSFLIGLTGNTEAGKTSVEENRIKLKNRYGTLIGGVHRGVTDFMAVGPFAFYAGTGNVLGNYKSVVNETTGVVIRNDLKGAPKDQTKVTYVTPRFFGVQAGYSYTPDGNQTGEAKLATKALAPKDGGMTPVGQNVHEFGFNFKKEFANSFGLQLSATSLFGKSKNTKNHHDAGYSDIAAYALGLVINYGGFSIGGEYLDNGRSLEWNGLTGNDSGRLFNVGVGYSYDRHGVSLGYLHTKRKLGRNKTTNFNYGTTKANVGALSYDYKLAKGLKLYAEGVAFQYKTSSTAQAAAWKAATMASKDAVGKNNGHAVMLGSAISF